MSTKTNWIPKNQPLNFKKHFKKRYIPLLLFLAILSCNATQIADMRLSKSQIEQKLNQAKVQNHLAKTITKDGRTIFFAQATNRSNQDSLPVFIFVHGTPGALSNSMQYLKDATLLQNGLVVAYDRPGFGYSEYGQPSPTLDGQVQSLKILMDQFPNQAIYLVGHSYGAAVILQAAMDYPKQVKGLVWLGGVVHSAWKEKSWWRYPLRYPPVKWLFPSSMYVSNEEILGLRKSLKAIEHRWNEVTCPVTLLQGGKDWLANPSNTAYADSMLVSSAQKKVLIYPERSHFFYFSQPELVVEALLEIVL